MSRITVLASYHRRRGQANPYVDLLEQSLADIEIAEFSWSRAMFGQYDIFHVHWPEQVFRSRSRLATYVKMLLTYTLLWGLRKRKTAVVRTAHNSFPHESPSRAESRVLSAIDMQTHATIVLNSQAGNLEDPSVFFIPHGDYSPWFARYLTPAVESVKGRLLVFGKIRAYKGIDRVIELASRASGDLTFRITGSPASEELAENLRAAEYQYIALSTSLRHLTDEELAAEIYAAEAVLLPYHEVENSGVALLALSLGKPIIVTASASMSDLQREVGKEWVQLVDKVSIACLLEALQNLRSLERGLRPRFRDRDWQTSAVRHLEAFRYALKQVS